MQKCVHTSATHANCQLFVHNFALYHALSAKLQHVMKFNATTTVNCEHIVNNNVVIRVRPPMVAHGTHQGQIPTPARNPTPPTANLI